MIIHDFDRLGSVGRPAESVREQVRDDLEHAVAVGDEHGRVAFLVPEVDLTPPGYLDRGGVAVLAAREGVLNIVTCAVLEVRVVEK